MTDDLQIGDRIIGTSKALAHRVNTTGSVTDTHPLGYWVQWDINLANPRKPATSNFVFTSEIELLGERTVQNVHLMNFHHLAPNHCISFTVIDGVPDTNSINMEVLT